MTTWWVIYRTGTVRRWPSAWLSLRDTAILAVFNCVSKLRGGLVCLGRGAVLCPQRRQRRQPLAVACQRRRLVAPDPALENVPLVFGQPVVVQIIERAVGSRGMRAARAVLRVPAPGMGLSHIEPKAGGN